MQKSIRLGEMWELGDEIGGGGFGKVYEAKSSTLDRAVAKLVRKTPGADREMLLGHVSGIRNVIPVIDSGETADSYVIVMPRAEMSLLQYIEANGGALALDVVKTILTDVGTALSDMDGKIVHRDIKPANILLLNGFWCIADFGISRYAEASTATDTMKYSMSAAYAAPERWRYEHATIAADVYSWGAIAFQLVTGKLPFGGPQWEDFRSQHLHDVVPELGSVPASLGALINECLIKAPGARPSPTDLIGRLERISDSKPNSGLSKLQSVNLQAVTKLMQSEAAESKIQSEAAVRKDLAGAASKSFADISNTVFSTITESASAAEKTKGRNSSWNIALGKATLRLDEFEITSRKPWGSFKPPFTVIAHSAIGVVMPANRHGYQGRDHSLWYCDAQKAGQFQWFEVAFMGNPMLRRQTSKSPCAISPDELAGKAFWPAIMEVQPAWPFTVLQSHDLEDFVARWANWFASAAEGTLTFPSQMPEREPSGSWRRS